MSTQVSLFDLPSPGARETVRIQKPTPSPASLRDEAIERVEKNAAEGFMDAAIEAVRKCAVKHSTFTTDEVLKELTAKTRDMRALGPCMKRAEKLGYIVPTDRVRNTDRASRHAAPLRIWCSLIWGGVR